MPDLEGRKRILEIHLKNKPLAKDVEVADLAKRTDGYSGADLSALVNEGIMLAIRAVVAKGGDLSKDSLQNERVGMKAFLEAMEKVRPTSRTDLTKYNKIMKDFEYVR
jgi:transitional endoplasmic reticulum ATPase